MRSKTLLKLSKQQTYVALLRGINVGGHKKVPMVELKKILTKNGFENVQTLLASGNVVFDAKETNLEKLRKEISHLLKGAFSFDIQVILLPYDEICHLVSSKPFAKYRPDSDTRLNATFLSTPVKNSPISTYEGFKLILIRPNVVLSILEEASIKTVDVMKVIEEQFGKDVTTRNWNTVEKIAHLR